MVRRFLLALAASVAVHGLLLAVAPRLAPRAAGGAAVIDLDVIEGAGDAPAQPEDPGDARAARRPGARNAEPAAGAPGIVAPEPVVAPPPDVPEGEASGARANAAVDPSALPAEELPAGANGIPVAVAETGSIAARDGAGDGVSAGRGGILGGDSGSAGPGVAGGGAGTPSAHAALLARLRARTAGCYPRAAVRRAVEGVARVSFCVGDDGAPTDLRLVASSGSALLDDAAIGCVVRGAAPLPDAGACVKVPIDFHLRR